MNQELYDKVINEWNKHKASQRVEIPEAPKQSSVEKADDSTAEVDGEMTATIEEAREEA